MGDGFKLIQKNKKAYFNYEIIEELECGMELQGTEVKSVREGKCSFSDSYVTAKDLQLTLIGFLIQPYSHGNIFNHDSHRSRRLLLHKNEIRRFSQRIKEQGLTLIPLKMYFSKNNLVKVELALCKGKKVYDKRQSIAAKDAKRDIERTMKSRYR